MQERAENRGTIESLLEHEFIENFREGNMRNKILSETEQGPLNTVLYKFYVAYLLNELFIHKIRFIKKIKEVDEKWPAFEKQWLKENKIERNNDKALEFELDTFCKHVRQLFGYFEAERFKRHTIKERDGMLKLLVSDLKEELANMYAKDMELLLIQSFDRLSLGYDSINISYFKQGIAINKANQLELEEQK